MPNWAIVLNEINEHQVSHMRLARQSVDVIRRKYLTELHKKTGRNVIAYYSGFLSKPGILQTDINDEDKNGFMMAISQMNWPIGLTQHDSRITL